MIYTHRKNVTFDDFSVLTEFYHGIPQHNCVFNYFCANLTNTPADIIIYSYLTESQKQKLYFYLSQNINLHQKKVNLIEFDAN